MFWPCSRPNFPGSPFMGSFRLPLMLLPQAVRGKAVNSPTVSGRLRDMLIGYMRVSKADGSQVVHLQRDALLAAGVDVLAARLRTPLQIEQHLTLALEPGFQASEKPITEAIADSALSKQIDGVEATLNRNGYTTKVLTEMLGVKAGELRGLFKNELGAERTRDLKEQMLSAGLPV